MNHSPDIPGFSAEDRPAWQIWALLKQELLFLCWACMEVAVVAPIALTIMRWSQPSAGLQVTLWLLALVLLPFNLVRLLSALGTSRSRQWRVLVAALVITQLVCWRGILYAPRPFFDLSWLGEFFGRVGDLANPLWARDFTVFLFVLLAWWRGLRLAQLAPDIHRIGLRLRAGGLLFLPIALFLRPSGTVWGVTPFILLYYLAGLMAVALIRAEQIERERSGFAASLTPRWLLTIFAASLLAVAFAGFVAALLNDEALRIMSGWLAPLWTALTAAFAVSISTAAFLLAPVMSLLTMLITWAIAALSRTFTSIGLGTGGLPDLAALQPFNELLRQREALALSLPQTLSRSLTVAVMIAVAAVITFALTRVFRQPPAARRSATAEPGAAAKDSPPRNFGERLLQRLGVMRRWRTAASIRRIYRDMCLAASGAGYPRGLSQTPYEYQPVLDALWPDNRADSSIITEAFIRVRYGEIPETEIELETIRVAWRRLSDISAGGIPASRIPE